MSEPATDRPIFWQRFDQLANGRTITQVEREAGIGVGTLAKAHKANQSPGTFATIEAVARFFGVPAVDMLRDQAEAPAADQSLRRIPLQCLVASHLNPRRTFDDAAEAELADGIAHKGLLQNLVVRPDADQPSIFWIVAGERRSRALRRLEKQGRLPEDLATLGIPCKVVSIGDEEHVAIALLENLQRVDVNPMEEAEALERLHRANPEKWSTQALAEQIGKTQRFVQYRIALAKKLPEEAKTALRDGNITVEQARVICSAPDEERDKLSARAINASIHAPNLADLLTHDMFAAEYALFTAEDAAKANLETWTDPNTEELFYTDYDTAYALQEKAIDAKQQHFLDAGADFVEVTDWFRADHFPPGGKGVVIQIDDSTGKVVIHEGVQNKSVTAGSAASSAGAPGKVPKVSKWEVESRYRLDIRKAGEKLAADVGKRIKPVDALSLIIYDNCVAMGFRATNPHTRGAEGAALKALANAARSCKAGDVAAFKAIRDAALTEIDTAFAELVASMLYVGERQLSPAIVVLAQRNKIAIPAILRHTPKQRAEALQRIEEELAGQTDLEHAIAEKADAEAEDEAA
jgi:ParB/RepB/Spo0J family partition protein